MHSSLLLVCHKVPQQSSPKLNHSVIVISSCAANTEAEILVPCVTQERSLPLLVGHVFRYISGVFSVTRT